MDLVSSLKGIGLLIAAMSAFALIESLVPLRVRGDWSKQHLIPNLTLTVITFVTNVVYNLAVLFGLVWLQAGGSRLAQLHRSSNARRDWHRHSDAGPGLVRNAHLDAQVCLDVALSQRASLGYGS
jgi:hypothetical protein